MNAQQIQSIIRAILLSSGTIIVGKGITDEATWSIVVGFVVGIVPLIWSWLHHAAPPATPASTPPPRSPTLPLMLLFCAGGILAAGFLAGCTTPAPTITYRAAATTQVSVETAMNEWGAYVATVHPPATQEAAVKAAYEKYQTAFAFACDLGSAYASTTITNSAGTAPAMLALQNAEANAGQDIADLETLISSFGVTLK